MVKIVKVVPTNPALSLAYRVLAPLVSLVVVWSVLGAGALLGRAGLTAAVTAGMLFALSPYLSYYNVVVWERLVPARVPSVDWVIVMGVPIPVPRITLGYEKQVIAVNVGGALVPIAASILFLWAASTVRPDSLAAFVFSFSFVSLVTYATSRVIPGVGIAVPAIVPPVAAALSVVALMGWSPASAFVAYAAGSLGSLFGADVLRLLRDLDKVQAPFISIGGVGVFDGVFLSGAISFMLAA